VIGESILATDEATIEESQPRRHQHDQAGASIPGAEPRDQGAEPRDQGAEPRILGSIFRKVKDLPHIRRHMPVELERLFDPNGFDIYKLADSEFAKLAAVA
jgi:hypothetical protein